MKNELQAIATIFSLINPVICVAMFAKQFSDATKSVKIANATKAVLTIAAILVVAAFLGSRILHLFGISLDDFAVAGGGVLAWIGIGMLTGGASRSGATTDAAADSSTETNRTYMPMVLFAASPGTITGVITVSTAHTGLSIPISALIAIGVVLLILSRITQMTSSSLPV